MRALVILFCACLVGCSSARLKRCDEKALDADLLVCSEQIQGPFRLCKKPVDLYRCSDPQ